MLDMDGTIPPQLVLVESLVYVDGVPQSVAGRSSSTRDQFNV